MDIKELFEKEHDFDVSYYLQKIIKDEKHILPAKDAKEDDCRYEKCENLELLLVSIKASLLQAGKENLASRITVDHIDFVSSLVCSIKNYECCDYVCNMCPRNLLAEVVEFLRDSDDISYFKWVTKDSLNRKVEFSDAGSIIAEQFEEISRKIKIHIYHIYRQYSELKYLKKYLCNNEVILSVDFSKNYSNKQHHEIRSAYFRHESFTLYTLLH